MFLRLFVIAITLAVGVGLGRYLWPLQPSLGLEAIAGEHDGEESHVHGQGAYVCPMHPDVITDKPGTCPVCGMALVPARQDRDRTAGEPGGDLTTRPTVRIDPEVVHNLGVKTTPVRRVTLVRRIETPGFVQQIQPGKTKRVTAPLDAHVIDVSFVPGRWLDRGQPLMVLESEELLSAEQAHLALLSQDTVEVHIAREAPLEAPDSADGAPSRPTSLDESRRRLAHLGLSSGDIRRLEETGEASARLTLSASYPAMVDARRFQVGGQVKRGDLLFELTGMARASVLANAFQRDAAWIQTGQPAEVRLPHVSGEVWSGVVNQGAVSIDPTSQNIGVRLSFSAPTPLLKSAMYVVATIHGDVRKDALAVPLEALIRTETEDRVVVALGEGRFRPMAVRIGIEAGGQVEILDGLQEGDEVVSAAQFLIDSESSLQASFQRMTGQPSQ